MNRREIASSETIIITSTREVKAAAQTTRPSFFNGYVEADAVVGETLALTPMSSVGDKDGDGVASVAHLSFNLRKTSSRNISPLLLAVPCRNTHLRGW